jgi:predicted negative regulator of RcsB-dependent stress response
MLLQLLGILAFAAIVVALFVRPAGVLAIVLAVGIVGAGIIVSWNDVEQHRQQRAAQAAFQQEKASASAVTVPPPNSAHSGS